MTAEQALLEIMQSLKGDVKIATVEKTIIARGLQLPKDVGTTMADLTYPPSSSSMYPEDRCFLFRTGDGVYRLRRTWRKESVDAIPLVARVSRKQFIEANGATCDNWTWSWSFVDQTRRLVIFGAWDMHTEGSRALILAESWAISPKGKKSSGYPQSREHIRLIEDEGYALYTFPMAHSSRNLGDDETGPAAIGGFVPELSARELVRLGGSWYASDGIATEVFPEEIEPQIGFPEGAAKTVTVNGFERSRKARAACIAHYGAVCAVCAFDFEAVYGPIARGLIHVHHRKLLAGVGKEYLVDPIKDLIPVCPNCHAVIHLTTVPLEPDDLREIVQRSR